MALSYCILWTQVFCFLMLSSLADKEYVHRHYPDGEHDVEFDHEAILGSHDVNDDFSKMSAHEAKLKLAQLVKKMDSDGDSYISKAEISDWVLKSFRSQDEIEALEKLKEVDSNNDGHVTWSEYVKKVYGYTVEELGVFAEDTSNEMQTFLRMVKDDENKFRTADRDRNEILNNEEYSAFIFPTDYEFMHEYEIIRTLNDIDRNGDSRVTFDEYMGESNPDKEQLIVDKENFKVYDKNNDESLDHDELKSWILPDRRTTADEEADHLMYETDVNEADGRLTMQEILDRHDIWVGSAATDYGNSLKHDPAEL